MEVRFLMRQDPCTKVESGYNEATIFGKLISKKRDLRREQRRLKCMERPPPYWQNAKTRQRPAFDAGIGKPPDEDLSMFRHQGVE
jgi:hypothetical protein